MRFLKNCYPNRYKKAFSSLRSVRLKKVTCNCTNSKSETQNYNIIFFHKIKNASNFAKVVLCFREGGEGEMCEKPGK